jgi:hypothetical protein
MTIMLDIYKIVNPNIASTQLLLSKNTQAPLRGLGYMLCLSHIRDWLTPFAGERALYPDREVSNGSENTTLNVLRSA